ncbi:unnamed protein product [Thlaspi arvense]|uniref:DUF7950 domain-containing protein n=1 Tax=Thlaspi arvense TaxID=13288 RepID=A0AAU9S3T2_THLAR|nr:unnamed protein product [Thlaspi arvense]
MIRAFTTPSTAAKTAEIMSRPGQLFGFNPPCFVTPRLPLPTLLKPPQNQINLPLLRPQIVPQTIEPSKAIDLNEEAEVPEEKDLIKQLEGPVRSRVIAPQPVRPVGSSIIVNNIREEPGSSSDPGSDRVPKKKVEEQMESEVVPAVVSDSSNRVRLANSAYRKMVGQPECSWLGSVGACKRICGEIGIQFLEKRVVPVESKRFSCWVTIEWGRNEENRSVRAFCEATRLACESKDYLFAWRFHAGEASGYGSGPGSGNIA